MSISSLDLPHLNIGVLIKYINIKAKKLINKIDELTSADLNVGIADNKLAHSIKIGNKNDLLKNIKLSRLSLEKRAFFKNEIDKTFQKLIKN